MSYTPLEADVKEYLAQIERHRDNMTTAILSDQGERVPRDILDAAVAQVQSAYKGVEFWIRFHAKARAVNVNAATGSGGPGGSPGGSHGATAHWGDTTVGASRLPTQGS